MENKNIEEIMKIIIFSGEAKSLSMEAIKSAKDKNFEEADKKIEEARNSSLEAHRMQTALLSKEASGEKVDIDLLTIHSQDHLMTSMAFIDLAKEIIDLYKERN